MVYYRRYHQKDEKEESTKVDLDKKNMKKILLLVAFGVILFWGLNNLSLLGNGIDTILTLLAPFIMGLCIAFILNIPVRFLENLYIKWKRKGNKLEKANKKTKVAKVEKETKTDKEKENIKIPPLIRLCTIVVSLLIIVGIIWLLLFLVIPELVNAFNMFKENIPGITENVKAWLERLMHRYPDMIAQIRAIHIDWNSIDANIKTFLQTGITGAISSSFTFVISFFTGMFNFIMGLIFAIYILAQKERLTIQLKKLIHAFLPKKRADKLIAIGTVTNNKFSGFFGGQFADACLLGLMVFVCMSLFKFPYALTISVVIGFTALIPFFGAFIGAIIGAILIAVISPVKAFWFIVLVVVLQQVDGNLTYPRIVGNSVGLPAIWVMVSITLGGSLMGIMGMLIAVPAASVIYTLLGKSVHKRLKAKEIEVK